MSNTQDSHEIDKHKISDVVVFNIGDTCFEVLNLEDNKLFSGINYTYNETLVVPIIENTPEEKDLTVIKSIHFVT